MRNSDRKHIYRYFVALIDEKNDTNFVSVQRQSI